ncbi:GNAT family N-acetyltransferase [Pseudoneobacillus sp. C159]
MHVLTKNLIPATLAMLDRINDLYLNCREHLLAHNILQWDENYPNKDYFEHCIENQDLFVLKDDATVLGHVVLNEWQSEEWENILWQGINPIVIHSLIISPKWQGKGTGTRFVGLCEEYAREKGYKSIRLDAFSGNPTAIRLYEKLGYQKRGSVFFSSKPEGHQEYICFEKEL